MSLNALHLCKLWHHFRFAERSPLYPKEVPMPELPVLPLWDVLYLNGIALVLTGVLVALLDDGRKPPEAWDELPPLANPYAEI
jgi:hypothetical protein